GFPGSAFTWKSFSSTHHLAQCGSNRWGSYTFSISMGNPILTVMQSWCDKIVCMTYYGGKELAASFRTVRYNTIKIEEEVEEKNCGFQAPPETRTVAKMLAHINNTTSFPLLVHRDQKMSTMQGFNFMAVLGPMVAEEQKAHTKAELIEKLKKSRDEFGDWLE